MSFPIIDINPVYLIIIPMVGPILGVIMSQCPYAFKKWIAFLIMISPAFIYLLIMPTKDLLFYSIATYTLGLLGGSLIFWLQFKK